MIIDFHTHTFPDKIADKTIEHLAQAAGINPYRAGTVDSLKESMKRSGIDACVVLPVATSVKQVESINRLSAELNGKDGLYFSGAIHPDCENVEDILDEVKKAGLFGIKIHPDYQGVYFNDERYIRILKAAAERELITVTHAGVDLAYPNDIHCTPDMVAEVLERLEGIIDDKLVLAHMGAAALPERVSEMLVGRPIYFDTAFVLNMYPEKCLDIIKRHGAEHVLFATDSPWADQKEFANILNALPLDEEEKNKIFYLNAQKLLRIK